MLSAVVAGSLGAIEAGSLCAEYRCSKLTHCLAIVAGSLYVDLLNEEVMLCRVVMKV